MRVRGTGGLGVVVTQIIEYDVSLTVGVHADVHRPGCTQAMANWPINIAKIASARVIISTTLNDPFPPPFSATL